MPRTRGGGTNPFAAERRKIQASGILDALIEYAEGRRTMSPGQASAALGALPDLATLSLPDERDCDKEGKGKIAESIVDPQR